MEVTRRGFLSLCATSVVGLVVPPNAEPIIQRVMPLVPPPNFEVVRYSMGLIPESMIPVEPGKVTILRARPGIILRPDKLVLNVPGFNLLHLGTHGEPIMENEVDSEMFTSTAYGMRMDFATLEPGQEIVLAAVNRNKQAATLIGSMMGRSLREITPEMLAEREEREKYFEHAYCAAIGNDDEDDEDDADCDGYTCFDTRKGLTKGWSVKETNIGKQYYCPKHSENQS